MRADTERRDLAKPLGKTTFGAMLRGVYPGVGPHKSTSGAVNGLYLLR